MLDVSESCATALLEAHAWNEHATVDAYFGNPAGCSLQSTLECTIRTGVHPDYRGYAVRTSMQAAVISGQICWTGRQGWLCAGALQTANLAAAAEPGNQSAAEHSGAAAGAAAGKEGVRQERQRACIVCFEAGRRQSVRLPCGHATCDACWKVGFAYNPDLQS